MSDVFHTGSPDSTMWEFKHGNGNFKKGDVASLREIKRRASRHTLIHRDSFSTAGHKLNSNHQGTSHEPQDGPEARFLSLEHSVYEMHTRLNRMEESHALLSSKCQVLTESLIRCHQVRFCYPISLKMCFSNAIDPVDELHVVLHQFFSSREQSRLSRE